jgi:hypothetical protein
MRAGIGDQQHVAFVNGRPAPNGRAVHTEALFEGGFRQLVDGIRNVLPKARQVGESEVQHLDSVLFRELQDTFRISHGLLLLLPGSAPAMTLYRIPARVVNTRKLMWGWSGKLSCLLQSIASISEPNGSVEVSVGARKSIVFIGAISESYCASGNSPERPSGSRSVWQNENGTLPGH